ncbi:hypothetical protein B0T16DRAFT_344447 [Cercophora newfieldiana]|uniref:AAA+ ATPase domain-containing protein n=1 Tax=Cercophora newfieldiana TaxID=92897 RepID=A0AA39YQU6_9PEZI|nr:hypothetical protein B0T16DRAFT_344447 [Cercophora newfieldiana]
MSLQDRYQKLPEISVTPARPQKNGNLEVDMDAEMANVVVEELEDSLPLNSRSVKVRPQVRKCDVTHFKNHFSDNEPLYAVDVLESESSEIGPQMQDEHKIRETAMKTRTKDERVRLANIKAAAAAMPAPARAAVGFHFEDSGKKVVLRIRIQSPAILRILSRIITNGEEVWTTKPRTFIRPFRPLIFHHKRVQQELETLQARWGSLERLDPAVGTPSSMTGSEHDGSGMSLPVDDCPDALAELRAYVKFIDDEVMTFYTKYDGNKPEKSLPPKIRFHDLWYLFRVGDLMFRPVGTGADKELGNISLGNRTWRCYGVRPHWSQYRIAPAEHRSTSGEDRDDNERSSFGVHCYYIDYTGEEYCVVTETFEIPPFKGEQNIRSLKIFPYRYIPNLKEVYRNTIELGRRFIQSTKVQHASYQGWTTVVTPSGRPSTDAEGRTLSRPEFIDSEVIVDFVEAYQTCPSWKPEAVVIKPQETNSHQVEDDFPIIWWSDADRSRHLRESNEIIILRSGITVYQRNDNLSSAEPGHDKLLVKIRDNDINGRQTTEDDLNMDPDDPRCDLPLLPSRIFAYVLRDRKFAQLIVHQLKEVKRSGDAFTYLKIKQRHKDIIQSLVEDHFQRKSSDRAGGVDFSSIDLIRGKGKGLIILLHGVPGVGKTATAEAIAAANGKPLFPITCGDLGLTPESVEAALLRIFRLADTWNCVLLLDEVDTFFSQRAKGDAALARNALVSVFLRVLEYYDGLLFLTTNRPGALDEAFSSRIHLKLHYPRLSADQTKEIWEMNIDRLEKIERERCARNPNAQPLRIAKKGIKRFADEIFSAQEKKGTVWNGRQIRNAFQVASSLAHYEARRDGAPPALRVDHFKTIHIVTEDFEEYVHETIGKTSGEQAFERGDRADHFVSRHQQFHDDDDDSGHEIEERKESLNWYDEPRTSRPGFRGVEGGRRRRPSSIDPARRSMSPNMAGPSSRGTSSIFHHGSADSRAGSSRMAPPVSPRHHPHHRPMKRPSIEISDANDAYLSPDLAKNSDGRDWGMSGRKRDRSQEVDHRRLKKKPKGSSEDEEDGDELD